MAHALWLATLLAPGPGPELVAVPGGLVARGAFPWREGDAFLAISSSGEFRDLVEAIDGSPAPKVAVTAHPDSTIGRAAQVVLPVTVSSQRAITHTQAFLGAVAACLAVWAWMGRASIGEVVEACPVPLLVSGGRREADLSVAVGRAREAVQGGAAGVVYGRYVFQDPDPGRALAALLEAVRG